jgi:hypothetical protein
LKVWQMSETVRRRSANRSLREVLVMSRPASATLPSVGGPRTTTNADSSTWMFTSSSAVTVVSPTW